nr:MAG: ABC transporter substrate-binding protein [Hyphomicrobiales bacterium]
MGNNMRYSKCAQAMRAISAALLAVAATIACSDSNQIAAETNESPASTTQDLLPITLNAGNRSLTKLPLVIAWDQGLFEKHGLDMNMLIPAPEFDGGKEIFPKPGMEDAVPEAWFRGGTPMLLGAVRAPDEPHLIDIGSTDCTVRSNVIGRMGIESEISSLEDLRGRRIGVSNITNTLGFQARLLAQRMGWDYRTDITIVDAQNDGLEELAEGSVDVILVNEIAYSLAKSAGYPVLFDTGDWNEAIGGNSVAVDPVWLEEPVNREKARRLMMAIAEAISIFHRQPEVARRVLREWNGVQDDTLLEDIMVRGAWLPRKPYACVEGLRKTIELYPELGTERHSAEEFYDNSIMNEIDASGFLDGLYL